MKKFSTKLLSCLIIALCLLSAVSMCIPVNAAGISLCTSEDTHFSFKGTCNISYNVTGAFMDVTVKSTASNNNNEKITLEIYITNRDVTKTYTYYSDGEEHTYKNIYLGLSGGSNVGFTFTGANPEITITTNLKIVS